MKHVKRGIACGLMGLMILFAGCAKKGVDLSQEVTSPETSQQGETMAMPQENTQVQSVSFVTGLEDKRINFDFDTYTLSQESRNVLSEIYAYLKETPHVKIQIEGHCDERGTNEYNVALGDRRAASAKNYLVSLGIDPVRITMISYGEEQPTDPGHSEEAWAKNRRDQFSFSQ
ncbi:MAG: peptidoglycan-associated lipoprotein Pal [Desulfomonilia bacterium]